MDKKELTKIAIALLLIVAIYAAFRYGKKVMSRIQERRANKDLDKRINKKNLSYGESQYNVFAKSLISAMDGLFTDEETIFDVFKKMKTIDDVLQLQVAFSDVEDENESLSEWLHGDLSSSEIKTLNNILTEKQIVYSF